MVEFQVNIDAVLRGFPGLPFSAINLSRAFIQGIEPLWGLRYEEGKFFLNISGGATLIEPINPDGSKALDTMNNAAGAFAVLNTALQMPNPTTQPELYNISRDIPYTLKYRNKQIIRAIGEIGYGNFSFTANFRYSSPITNVDKLFFLLGVTTNNNLAGLDGFFRDYASKPYTVWDFILAYEAGRARWTFHIFNAFNRIYTTLPGTLNEQRSFAIQCVLRLQGEAGKTN